MEKLIDAKTIADRIHWDQQTVYRKARDGEIPGLVRLGRSIRFRESAIIAWLRSSEMKRATEDVS